MNTDKFIEKAKKIHNNKYDYSKVKYIDYQTKVCIICPEHGEFWQTPANHLTYKRGCKKCADKLRGINKRQNINFFIQKSNEIHNNKYDYSKVKYINNSSPVCIICPDHGEFWQTPQVHLRGSGCPKCANNKTHIRCNKGVNKFIDDANKIHNNKYDYSKVEYIDNKTKVCIICPEHGEFWQIPTHHLRGGNCPKCVGRIKFTQEEFIQRANEVHNYKYDYSKVNYINIHTKVCIICSKHGEFWQTPDKHLLGQGCPKCNNSILEKEISIFLTDNNIDYVEQKTFDWLKYKDFFIS